MLKIEDVQRRAAEVNTLAKSGKVSQARTLERELWLEVFSTIQELGLLGIGLAPGLAKAALASREAFAVTGTIEGTGEEK